MSRNISQKTNFSTGRIGKNTMGRIGTEQYDGAVKKLTNFNVLMQGSISRRQGTTLEHILFDNYNNEVVKAFPFSFNIDSSYLLLFTDKKVQVFESDTFNEVAVIDSPYSDSVIPDIKTTQFGNYLYIVDGNNPPHTLTRGTNNFWQLSETPFIIPPTIEAGREEEIVTLHSGDTVAVGSNIQFTTTNTAVYADLRRTVVGEFGGQWEVTGVDVADNKYTAKVIRGQQQFVGQKVTFLGSPSTVLSLSTTSVVKGTEVEIKSVKSLTDTTEVSAFVPNEGTTLFINGGVIELKPDTINTTNTLIKGVIVSTLNAKDPTSVFHFTSKEFKQGNNPRAVSQHEGRLAYGGTPNNPQRVWLSKPGDFTDFQVGVDAGDGIEIDLVSDRAAKIQWLTSSRGLIAGCSGSEVVITSVVNQVFGPATVTQRECTTYGSVSQQPLIADNKVVFVQSGGQKIRGYGYDFQTDNYSGIDLTELCSDITFSGVKRIQYTNKPQPTLYVLKNDGSLCMALANLTQHRIGWADFETSGYIVDVVVIGGNPVDNVFIVIIRGGKLVIEKLEASLALDTSSVFFDSTVIVDNKKTGFTPDNSYQDYVYHIHNNDKGVEQITIRHAFDWVCKEVDRTGKSNTFIGDPDLSYSSTPTVFGNTVTVQYHVTPPPVALPFVNMNDGWITFAIEGITASFSIVYEWCKADVQITAGTLAVKVVDNAGGQQSIDCSSVHGVASLMLSGNTFVAADSEWVKVSTLLLRPSGSLSGIGFETMTGSIPPIVAAEHNDNIENAGVILAAAMENNFWHKGLVRDSEVINEIRSIRFTNTNTVVVNYIDGTSRDAPLSELTIDGRKMDDMEGFPVSRPAHTTYEDCKGVGWWLGAIIDKTRNMPVKDVHHLDFETSTHMAGGQYTDRITTPHLANLRVGVKVDGFFYGEYDVEFSGGLTIEGLPVDRLVDIQVGSLYKSKMVTLPLDYDYGRGSMVYQWGRPVKSMVQVWDSTRSFRVQGDSVPSRYAFDNVGEPEPLYSGRIDFGGKGANEDGIVYEIECDAPYPLNISGIFGIAETRTK